MKKGKYIELFFENFNLTQEIADNLKGKSKREQVEFIFDLINDENSLINNRELLEKNFSKEFILITSECFKVLSTIINNPDSVEGFSDEEGKEYMKNMIVDNVVKELDSL